MSMNDEHVADRSLLLFADEVKKHFSFLEAKGFHSTRSEASLMRFESSKLAIDVYHDQRSYEIGLQIEDTRGSGSFSFSEILRLVHSKQAEQYRDYVTHTVQGVAEGVRKLAELFRKYIDDDILNDSKLFPRLRLLREKWAKKYAIETQLDQARRKSESAWAEKDFSKVVQVLAPLQEYLNLSDLRKLEYAKKHAGSKVVDP